MLEGSTEKVGVEFDPGESPYSITKRSGKKLYLPVDIHFVIQEAQLPRDHSHLAIIVLKDRVNIIEFQYQTIYKEREDF